MSTANLGRGISVSGGPEEVGEIVKGIDLDGRTILDIGFGTGGPAITLAKHHNAAKIVGIDVEPQLRNRAIKNIRQSFVADKIDLRIVEPGPMAFENDAFDVVFVKIQ